MRVEIGYDKYVKNRKGEIVVGGRGVALLEYNVDSTEDETSNNWILEIEGGIFYFQAQDARNAINFLRGIAPV